MVLDSEGEYLEKDSWSSNTVPPSDPHSYQNVAFLLDFSTIFLYTPTVGTSIVYNYKGENQAVEHSFRKTLWLGKKGFSWIPVSLQWGVWMLKFLHGFSNNKTCFGCLEWIVCVCVMMYVKFMSWKVRLEISVFSYAPLSSQSAWSFWPHLQTHLLPARSKNQYLLASIGFHLHFVNASNCIMSCTT